MVKAQAESIRVLVVEDHPVARSALCRILRRHVIVDEANGLREGAALLAANTYDVLIVDEVLGDGSGRRLLEQVDIASTSPRPRRVLMSGFHEPDGDVRPYDHFVQKPDDLLWLVRCIREIAGSR